MFSGYFLIILFPLTDKKIINSLGELTYNNLVNRYKAISLMSLKLLILYSYINLNLL